MNIPRTGGRLLVDALRIHGVDLVFGIPGESYLPVLDALYDTPEIRFISCRQEGGAAFMAEAYGKLTGRPGICFVTRGPGATNASIGLHTAFQDSTPLILFIGQVGGHVAEREGFQEMDYRRMYGQMAKWVAQIDRAAGRYKRAAAHPAAADMNRLRELLSQAHRPFVLLGGSGWTAQACEDVRAFVEANALPVGASYRCQDLLDNRLPNYVGDVAVGLNPALEKRILDADLILAVGPRLGEWTTVHYKLVGIPVPRQKLVHVHSGAEELGRVYQGELLINAGMPEFAAAAGQLAPVEARWAGALRQARAEYEAWQRPSAVPGGVNPGEIVAWLNGRLPPESIVTCGAGTYISWVHRFYRYTGFRTQLGPTSGAMGYGVPAAIAAKLVHPDRPVVAFSGDGCFLMNGQELATAKHYGAKVIFIVVNNGIYGTIRVNQETRYPGRVIGTDLSNPDFAALARSYGLGGEAVEKTSDFEAAFERAWKADTATLIELRVDPEATSPRATLSAIRAAAALGKTDCRR